MGAIANITHYQIVEQLYAGTRTLVYRGICTISQQPAIIKILKNDYPTFSELVQFRNQYIIAKSLNSPNIIQTYNLESYNHSYALIMEDFGGISLHEWIVNQENKLALSEFLEIGISLCNILEILYHNRIIHKDIKPSNILINPTTKQVKLIDFSIASLLPRETQTIQNANTLEGTLAYLSPEQTGRMNRGIDYRSDFYSLGVTFYKLLTEELPFISDDPMELVHSHLAKTAIPVHQINSHLPVVLSAIISKLMAKNAEDRYQSALGIKYDLEICLKQWQERGEIQSFTIGEGDISDRFTIPEKLYGREKEVQALLNAFDRIGDGDTEMMFVAGFSGIGKTAVINEVHKPIARQRGYFIKGKYDQFQRNIPFSAFVQAFRDLMGQLLSESDAQLQIWKSKILEVVGDNGQVLIDVIPELELIIGKQPTATELSGTSAQNRFNLLIQKFVKIFASQEHPLVVFIDDLQWSDSASLNLLKLLIQDTRYLLILGAYRDNEVSPAHPFILTVDEISKTGAVVNTITLQPLSLSDTNYLVADTLNCELSIAQPLTELIYQKTQGNPFFTTQFLKALYEDKHIIFNYKERYWQCDIAKVKALAITDDVVEFMAVQLQKLPIETQDILKLAACIGAQFDLDTLAIVSEKSSEDAAVALWRALQEGLIIPNTEIYKFFMQSDSISVANAAVNPIYRFLHDRVQQAAYSLIPEQQKTATHLKIGQLLQQNYSETEQEEKLFDIVGHLNRGIELITQPEKREALAKLNLKAGSKARNSTAYSAARIYVQTGIDLLNSDCWQSQYELALNLYVAATEASYLNGDFDGMEQIAIQVLQEAKTILDKVKIYEIKIIALTSQTKMLVALEVGRKALSELGVDFPNIPDKAQIDKVLQNLASQLQGREIAGLIDLPVMSDRSAQAAMQLLGILFPPVYLGTPGLVPFLSATMVQLSLQFGNTPASNMGYSIHGMVLCAFLGEVKTGYGFGRLALSLLERLNAQGMKPLVLNLFGAFIQHRQQALLETTPTLKDSYTSGIEIGDFIYAGFSAVVYTYISFFAGVDLDTLASEFAAYSAAIDRMKQNAAKIMTDIGGQALQQLRETVSQPDCLIGSIYDETVMLPKQKQDNDLGSISYAYIYKLMLAYLFGNYTAALNHLTQAKQYLMAASGTVFIPIFHFYAALTYITLFTTEIGAEQTEILSQVENHQTNLYQWAENAPMNHLHKWYLIEAEKQRVLGNKAEAMDLYDKAISGAKENEYIQEEALANELAARFYLDWGKEKVAAGYMQEAYYCYSRWGAKAKVTDLETRYPQLLQPILQQPKSGFNVLETLTSITYSATNVSSTSISDTLDFASVIQAAQLISSAIELDELLKQLTQIILQNSGGSKCVLVLPQDDIWYVKAISTLETTELCCEPLDDHPHVPIKLIQYVKNTQSVVVIDNLQTDLPVIDNHLIQRDPKSILCLPILNQGHLAGILYLKNQATAGIFNSDRLTIINFLCTQAAISLENARLYYQSQKTLVEVQQVEQQLQASQKFLQLVIDNIPQSVFWKDTQSVYLGCNRLFAGEAGLNFVQNIIGKTDYDLPWKKEESDWYRECDRRIMDSGIPEMGIIETQQQAGGKQTWAETNKVPLQDDNGTIIGILGTYQDISDRKQAESEKSRLISILEATSDLVGIADINGNNLYLNQAGQELLHIPASEANKFHISEVTAPAMLSILETEMFPKALRDGIWSGETILLSRSGEEIPASQVLMTHKNAQGEVEFLSTIIRDIRDSKRKSEALEQALEELQNTQIQLIQNEKMSALGNLVAGVAHEINNPVGFLNGNIKPALDYINDLFGLLDLVQSKYPQLHPEVQEEIENIDLDFIREDLPKLIASMQEGVTRITDISTSLRTFSRADTDHPVACNIHNGIDSTIMILKHRLKANTTRPEITVIKDYGDLPQIECYAGQLNQVFMNILANAIDALDEASIGRNYKDINNKIIIKTKLSPNNQQVTIHLQDNGKGMTSEVQEKIFDNLFTTKAVNKGTGLGLAIAHQIVVEKHQGQLIVNSIPNEGTEFIITLPL